MKTTETFDNKKLRSFGLIVGGIFAFISIWPIVFHGQPLRFWSMVLAVALVVPALVLPQLLKWPYRGWMALSHVLGWINTRIILGIIFYVIITPMAFLMRMFGYNPLSLSFDKSTPTYKVRVKSKNPKHMERQF